LEAIVSNITKTKLDCQYKGHPELAVIFRYIERIVHCLQACPDQDPAAQTRLAIQAVTCHLVAFCRALVARSGVSAQYTCILFSPSLMEALARDHSPAHGTWGSVY